MEKPYEGSILYAAFAQAVAAGFSHIGASEIRADAIGHVAIVLDRFSSADELYRPFTINGQPVTGIDEFRLRADPVRGDALSFDEERRLRKDLGDFILFILGIYPEYFRADHRRCPPGCRILWGENEDHLRTVGEESYRIVSVFDLFEYEKEAPLFTTLYQRFGQCVAALRDVRSGPLFRNWREQQNHRR